MKFPKAITAATPARWWVAATFVALLLTPFWRGGRDGSGYLFVAIALFFAWLAWSRDQQRTHIPISKALIAPFALFVVWLLASTAWAADGFAASLRALTLLSAVGLFALVRQLGVAKIARTRLRQLMLLGSVPVIGFGLYLYFDRVYDRAASFFYAPNAYALYLLLIWVVLLYEYKRKPHKIIVLGLLLVASQFLLIQSLATVVLALVVTFGFAAWLKFNKTQLIMIALSVVLGLLSALALVQLKTQIGSDNVGTPDEAAELIETKAAGVESRFDYWRSTADIYTDNLLIGVGADNFQNVYPEYQKDPSLFTENPHNVLFQTYAEAGVIGGSLMIFAVAVIVLFWWNRRNDREVTMYTLLLAVIFVHANFYQTSRYPVFWLFFAAVLALLLTSGLRARPQKVVARMNLLYLGLALAVAIPAGFHYRSDAYADTGFDFNRERNVVDSIFYLTESASLPPTDPRVLENLAVQNTYSGDFKQALTYANQAIDANDRGQAYGAKAFVLQQSGAPQVEVVRNYETAIEKDPFNSIDIFLNYTRYLIDQGDTARAVQLLDFILPYYEDEDLPRIIQFGDLPRRVALLEFQRARAASINGNEAQEISSLERVVQLYPEYELAQNILSQRREEINQ